jgi:hypothetical protein
MGRPYGQTETGRVAPFLFSGIGKFNEPRGDSSLRLRLGLPQ